MSIDAVGGLEKIIVGQKNFAEMTWQETLGVVRDVLTYQLFDIDGHPMSLGKMMTGLGLLAIGYAVSARAAAEVDRRVLIRVSDDLSFRHSARRFIFYLLFFLCSLFTLRAINVPITIFTVVGGALAVGIGFGSQNLVNNFISGVLVMMERPIRQGDFVEVEGISGQIELIGIRSTRLRTTNNTLMTIPNTTFIEKNLINWTASGTISRTVKIGVAYDTDIEKLKAQCLALLASVDGVLATPEPVMLFTDFGDNALTFDLVFSIRSTDFVVRRVIDSEVRFALNRLFVEQGISIPFPQRDIHVRTAPSHWKGAST